MEAPESPPEPPATVDRLRFDNRFTRSLPADAVPDNVPRPVRGAIYSRVRPQTVEKPRLLAHSPELVGELGWAESIVTDPEFAQAFTGNHTVDGMDPHAMRYGGHQFGHWAGQLGDGRAINLGEVVGADGDLRMLQLKGAGPTPYSRTADGLAVLRSSLREFVCSEAMHHLGVPTTRALSLCTTGEDVVRDMFYDGRPEAEPGAITCRVAPTFLRFGNYEILAAEGETDLLRTLADFTIRTLFEDIEADGTPASYLAWFREVCRRTAETIVHWQRVGFVHGVMNTDNMSIAGLTIDYGPYGWLEDYDPTWTPNTTDAAHRRYRFGTQDRVAGWNLARLGSALVPLVEEVEALQSALDDYATEFRTRWRAMAAAKLGLRTFDEDRGDASLVTDLFELLAAEETDMTVFFRRLATVPTAGPAAPSTLPRLRDAFYAPDALPRAHVRQLDAWLRRYVDRCRADGRPDLERRAGMDSVNPLFVPRNYLAQLAIDALENDDDPSVLHELQDALRHPYDEQPGRERFAEKRPEWARNRPGCSTLSCSS